MWGISKIKIADDGFNELLQVLKELRLCNDKPNTIILREVETPGLPDKYTGIPIREIIRFLIIRIGKKEKIIREESHDLNKITRELADKARDIFARQLQYCLLCMVALWLILNLYLQFCVYKLH